MKEELQIKRKMKVLKNWLQTQIWLLQLFSLITAILVFLITTLALKRLGFFHVQDSVTDYFHHIPANNSETAYVKPSTDSQSMTYIVNTPQCRIPDLSPFDWITKFYKFELQLVRSKENSRLPLININNNTVFVNPKTRSYYYNETERINCCWRTFWPLRIRDAYVVYSKKCYPFNEDEKAVVNRQLFRVECRLPNNKVYEDEFVILPWNYQSKQPYPRLAPLDKKSVTKIRKPSVLVIGMNSVSRLNLRRSMPLTLHTLQKMGAIEMLGYHKIVHNMYGNLVPLLTGLPYDKFEKLYRKNSKRPFSSSPSLWEDFAAKNYQSIFNWDNFFKSFNLKKNSTMGIRLHPKNYSFRPLCLKDKQQMGIAKEFETFLCEGFSYTIDELYIYLSQEYARSVSDKSNNKPHFDILWQAGHFQHSIPNTEVDTLYSDFFEILDREGLLRDTALIFMSDRGLDRGFYSYTYPGRAEANLPFMFIKMPDWWKEEYPEAYESLKVNKEKLITTFDVHETLKDILDPSRLVSKYDVIPLEKEDKNISQNVSSTGVSLFKSISDKRSCESAGILGDCSCHSYPTAVLDKSVMAKLSVILINELNDIISKEPQCETLQFYDFIYVKPIIGADYKQMPIKVKGINQSQNSSSTDFSVIFQTKPGYDIFEALVGYDLQNGLQIISSINRLNSYEDRVSCVDDFTNRFYCFCKSIA